MICLFFMILLGRHSLGTEDKDDGGVVIQAMNDFSLGLLLIALIEEEFSPIIMI